MKNNNSNFSIENNFQNDLFSKDNGLEFNQSNNIIFIELHIKFSLNFCFIIILIIINFIDKTETL